MRHFFIVGLVLSYSIVGQANPMSRSRQALGPDISNAFKQRHSVGAVRVSMTDNFAVKNRHSAVGPEMDVNNNNAARGGHSLGPGLSGRGDSFAIGARHETAEKKPSKNASRTSSKPLNLNRGF
jgi:hypothetical protein